MSIIDIIKIGQELLEFVNKSLSGVGLIKQCLEPSNKMVEQPALSSQQHVVESKPYHVYPPAFQLKTKRVETNYQGGTHKLGKGTFFNRPNHNLYIEDNKKLKGYTCEKEMQQSYSSVKTCHL